MASQLLILELSRWFCPKFRVHSVSLLFRGSPNSCSGDITTKTNTRRIKSCKGVSHPPGQQDKIQPVPFPPLALSSLLLFAANGRHSHQRWSVEGWPCLMDFSRAECTLTMAIGKSTSIRSLQSFGIIKSAFIYNCKYHINNVYRIAFFVHKNMISSLNTGSIAFLPRF